MKRARAWCYIQCDACGRIETPNWETNGPAVEAIYTPVGWEDIARRDPDRVTLYAHRCPDCVRRGRVVPDGAFAPEQEEGSLGYRWQWGAPR